MLQRSGESIPFTLVLLTSSYESLLKLFKKFLKVGVIFKLWSPYKSKHVLPEVSLFLSKHTECSSFCEKSFSSSVKYFVKLGKPCKKSSYDDSV